MFYGITTRMNWEDKGQHNQPHFHAYYGEHKAIFGLNGEILAGNFPARRGAPVKARALLHDEAFSS